MLLENFVISNVIFTRQAIFSTLYSGKQDHYDLRGSCVACRIKIVWNFFKNVPIFLVYPRYLLEIG